MLDCDAKPTKSIFLFSCVKSSMPQPQAADNDDVAINEVALHRAGVQSVARALLKDFLPGASDEVDGEDADAHSLAEANLVKTYDERSVMHSASMKLANGSFCSGGVGYISNLANGQATSESRRESAATELLRKQLLGKHGRKNTGGSQTGRHENRNGQVSSIRAPKPRPRRPRKEDSSDDDEGGRSRVGKKSRQDAITDSGDMKSRLKSKGDAQHQDVSQQQARNAAKRGSSYLDQVLSERSAKQQKKQQKRSSQV